MSNRHQTDQKNVPYTLVFETDFLKDATYTDVLPNKQMRKLAYAKVRHTCVPGVMQLTRQFHTANGLFYLEMIHLECSTAFTLSLNLHQPALIFPVVLKGDISISDFDHIILKEGQALAEILPAKSYSTTIQPGSFKVFLLLPSIATLGAYVPYLNKYCEQLLDGGDIEVFDIIKIGRRKRRLISNIVDCKEAVGHERDAKIWAMSISLIKLYTDNIRNVQQFFRKNDIELINKVKDYIDSHSYQNILLTVEGLSMLFDMNKRAITPLFKNEFNVSPYGYIISIRMELAREHLKNGLKIKEVANKLGYAAPETFSRAFKLHYGYLPSEIVI
ncbi:helix-turn-helix transcriptional regulator [Pedobacter sp. MC2016-14]|uniref:AraC family transcriptional regulator n=1 Tax=Pedobacter sp. MC2016-14 TaxID=2897327 RepID=UPI001E5EC687|nr:AraC family transcriptional regulator [Pedobacter sp. MC2016-14]MCD0489701.1 helix-turn-helix transcriptional regulator [Pedobacter sp. MC2016-14]